jgi:hypothetical protein
MLVVLLPAHASGDDSTMYALNQSIEIVSCFEVCSCMQPTNQSPAQLNLAPEKRQSNKSHLHLRGLALGSLHGWSQPEPIRPLSVRGLYLVLQTNKKAALR